MTGHVPNSTEHPKAACECSCDSRDTSDNNRTFTVNKSKESDSGAPRADFEKTEQPEKQTKAKRILSETAQRMPKRFGARSVFIISNQSSNCSGDDHVKHRSPIHDSQII